MSTYQYWNIILIVIKWRHHQSTSSAASNVTIQAADNLPLYGICCYMDEMVHRPPAVLAGVYPQCSEPLARFLVAAPRCYCFLTHFPFFTLHMKVRRPSCALLITYAVPWSRHVGRWVGSTGKLIDL